MNLFTEEIEPRFEDVQKQYLRCIEKTVRSNGYLQYLQKEIQEDFSGVNLNVEDEIYRGETLEFESAFKAIKFVGMRDRKSLQDIHNLEISKPTKEICDRITKVNLPMNDLHREIQKIEHTLEESAHKIHHSDKEIDEAAEEVLDIFGGTLSSLYKFNKHKLNNEVERLKQL